MKKLAFAISLLGISAAGHAHVRWFTESSPSVPQQSYQFDQVYLTLTVLAIAYCLFCYWLERVSLKNVRVSHFTNDRITFSGFEWNILKASIALMFMLNILDGIFLAPNLPPSEIGTSYAQIFQILVVVSAAASNCIFAIAILSCLVATGLNYGVAPSIDYIFEFLAIALAYLSLSINDQLTGWRARYPRLNRLDLSPSIFLRTLIGLQLVVLAIHNKLLDPNLGLQFLSQYPHVNFLNWAGLDFFKDIHFVYSAGLAELCFGLLLIFNISTRFVSLCVLFFFSVTSAMFGLHELIGHIPILVGLSIVAIHSKNKQDLESLSLFLSQIKSNLGAGVQPAIKKPH